MDVTKSIWAHMHNMKFKSYLIQILINKYQRWDRYINIFLAIAASGSIASWAVFQEYKVIFGVVIAGSQLLTVIKPYVPYNKYVKQLMKKATELDFIILELEALWFRLYQGSIVENEIYDEFNRLKVKSREILSFDDDIILNPTQKEEDKANEQMNSYSKNIYGSEVSMA